jgi:DNA-binding NtrC family response regulator
MLITRPRAGTAGLGARSVVGKSRAMEQVREAIRRFSALDIPVLITGETGVGKELIARALHDDGPRRAQPFLAVNCGSLPPTLLESELFGHERGAFTGALRAHPGFFVQAGRGTILLDEIGEMPSSSQVALLRVLESREIRAVGATKTVRVECRVVAATNAHLESLVQSGRFRRDLYYRLKRLALDVPPLRERREDIFPIIGHLLASRCSQGHAPEFTLALRERLLQYDWPGNVRELHNAIERMLALRPDSIQYDLSDFLDQDWAQAPAADRGTQEKVRTVIRVPANYTPPLPASRPWDVARPAVTEPVATGLPVVPAPLEHTLGLADAGLRTRLDARRRLERVRELFKAHRELSRAELIRLLGISANTATADLKLLRDEGVVERVEPSASPRSHYFRWCALPKPDLR